MILFLFSGPPALMLTLFLVTVLVRSAQRRAFLATLRPCPFCLSLVPRAAIVCRQCRSPLPAPPPRARVLPAPYCRTCGCCGRTLAWEDQGCWWCCKDLPPAAPRVVVEHP